MSSRWTADERRHSQSDMLERLQEPLTCSGTTGCGGAPPALSGERKI